MNNKKRLSFWVSMLIGQAFLWFSLVPGLKTTSDSLLYLKGAEYLIENGLTGIFQQEAFQAKPLLFSVFLIPFVNKLFLLKMLHSLLYGTTFYLANSLMKLLIKDTTFQWTFNLLMAFSVVVIMDHVFIWTEPLFLMSLLFYALQLYHNFESASKLHLILLTITGLLMCLLKHVGIFFVTIPALLALINAVYSKKKPAIILFSSLHFAAPIVYFLVWQWMVWELGGHHSRIDHFNGLDILGNYQLIASSIAKWFVIPVIADLVGWFILPLILAFMFYIVRLYSDQSIQWWAFSCLGMILIYLIILFTKGDMIFSDDDRYVSVIYPMMMLLLIVGLEKITESKPKIKPHLIILSGVIIVYNLARVAKNAWFWSEI
ncbi:MAG: hypothetical protein AAFQ94_07240 [Bacteroidota bacterium]